MSKETPKQRLRRLLDRMPLDEAARREADRLIEETPDADAQAFLDWLDELERETPGAIEEMIKSAAEGNDGSDD